MINHETYIKRCLEIAKNGLGHTSPNPMVGSVIVCNNTIIGEGYTSKHGGNHAEVNAINAVTNKALLKKATLYVTLEPCSHFGKTPPCSDLIIKHQIPDVVIGCTDDNPKVAGKGIKKLRLSGCKVTIGVLEEACKTHHKRFLTYHNKKRPYIVLKWAKSSDGFIAPKNKKQNRPVWITNQNSRQLVHKWRAEEQAILVGTNTVLLDNPSLTTRYWRGENPIRVVIDKHNKLSKDFTVFNDDAETIILSSTQKKENQNTAFIDYNLTTSIAKQICEVLYKKNINSIIIEGGSKTLQTFIDENLWDEARIFTGQVSFKTGTKAPKFKGTLKSTKTINKDILKFYTND